MFHYQDKNLKGNNPVCSLAGRKEALTYTAGGGVKWGNPVEGHKIWPYLFTSLAHKPLDQENPLRKFNTQTELHMSEVSITSFIAALSLRAKHKKQVQFPPARGQVNKVYAQ